MSSRISGLVGFFVGIVLAAGAVCAQEETPSLGDVARNYRKNKAEQTMPQQVPAPLPSHPVIDNDNLGQVMEDVNKARPVAPAKTVFSLDSSGNTLKMSSPDVTCSLSFNAKASSLLLRPVLIENLPLDELVKIDGPGSIQEQSLQLDLFNGTEWDLREVTVGLTLERTPGENAEAAARARVVPAAENSAPVTVERRSNVTLLYHLKTEAKPFSRTEFREMIGITPGADEDWRWSIVEAKGIRPPGRYAPSSLSEPLFGNPLPFVPEMNEQPGVVRPQKTPALGNGPGQDEPASDVAPQSR